MKPNTVHILPPELVSKIAAGEVIERPASAVKELLENALDANATTIEIHVENAGKKLISLRDNGTGIARTDLEKIFLRHATSKIASLDDLFQIHSLGFRGEALYSIAAISDVCLRSRTKDDETGWEIHLREGEVQDVRPVSMLEGTEITVQELFFNTPARRKFLKSDPTELHQIINLVMPYVILYPGRRFVLTAGKREILNLAAENSLISRIAQALALKTEHLIETEDELTKQHATTRIILGDTNIQRPRKDLQFIFVNNRPVHDHLINFHINKAYRTIFPPDIHPFFALFLWLPPESIDVNIHPTKREIKLQNSYNINSWLRAICEETLLSYSKAKQIDVLPVSSLETESTTEGTDTPEPSPTQATLQRQFTLAGDARATPTHETTPLPFSHGSLKEKLKNARFIGSFIKKYLLFESGFSLLVVDQHAAQERITFEKLLHHIKEGNTQTQQLLTPVTLRVSAQELVMWEVVKEKLEKLGFSTTLWDREHIAVHAHPILIKDVSIAVRNLLDTETRSHLDTESLTRRACRNSLMTGYDMGPQQAAYLCQELISSTDPFTCPHGRPTVIEIRDSALAKQFLRT